MTGSPTTTRPELTLPGLTGEALARAHDAVHTFGRSDAVADAAYERLAAARPVLLAFSGWPASGKDTIPVHVYRALGLDPVHLHFSVPLKHEVDQVLELCRAAPSEGVAVRTVVDTMHVDDVDAAAYAVGVAYATGLEGVDARSRSAEMRELLQYWGTDIRRRVDPQYWVRQALAPAVDTIADGRPCYLSDVRFTNEVLGAQSLGFVVVRLDITRATVVGRLSARDGLAYDPAALDAMMAQPAESELNGYSGFDLVVENDGPIEQGTGAVLAYLRGL